MNAQEITTLTSAIVAVIGAVTAAIVAIKSHSSITQKAIAAVSNVHLAVQNIATKAVNDVIRPSARYAASAIGTILVYDCTGSNLGSFAMQSGTGVAGYDTGSSGIAWSATQWARYPNAIHFDQDQSASDYTSDVLDSEAGAAPVGGAELATWVGKTRDNFELGKRPGQRPPAIYQSASNVSANVNALIARGITSGVFLWVANWNLSDAQAVAEVVAAAGPFPICAVQYTDKGLFDLSEVSLSWYNTRSKSPGTPTPPIPTPVPSGSQLGWTFCEACKGLFWYPEESASHCPEGGTHKAGKGNYIYSLPWKGTVS